MSIVIKFQTNNKLSEFFVKNIKKILLKYTSKNCILFILTI